MTSQFAEHQHNQYEEPMLGSRQQLDNLRNTAVEWSPEDISPQDIAELYIEIGKILLSREDATVSANFS